MCKPSRMDNIAEEAPSRAATLRALLAHATSRAYIAELEDKVGVSRFDLVGSQWFLNIFCILRKSDIDWVSPNAQEPSRAMTIVGHVFSVQKITNSARSTSNSLVMTQHLIIPLQMRLWQSADSLALLNRWIKVLQTHSIHFEFLHKNRE